MDLVSEVFPDYNPLPKLIDTFKILEATDEITDNEIVCEIIAGAFEEAGVLVEVKEELAYIINMLVDHDVLRFVGEGTPYLISNPQLQRSST